jgi:acetoin utilization protein AcuB
MSVNGYETRGVQFGVEVADCPGSVKEITDLIRAYEGRLACVLTSLSGAASGFRRVYLHAYGVDRAQVEQLKADLVLKARLLYIIDHRENRREEFG